MKTLILNEAQIRNLRIDEAIEAILREGDESNVIIYNGYLEQYKGQRCYVCKNPKEDFATGKMTKGMVAKLAKENNCPLFQIEYLGDKGLDVTANYRLAGAPVASNVSAPAAPQKNTSTLSPSTPEPAFNYKITISNIDKSANSRISRAKQLADILEEKGCDKVMAAAILGNACVESYASPYTVSSNYALGLFQWLYPTRRVALVKYLIPKINPKAQMPLQKEGENNDDYKVRLAEFFYTLCKDVEFLTLAEYQIDFMIKEASERGYWNGWKIHQKTNGYAGSVASLATEFESKFEQAKGVGLSDRKNYAKLVYNEIGGE